MHVFHALHVGTDVRVDDSRHGLRQLQWPRWRRRRRRHFDVCLDASKIPNKNLRDLVELALVALDVLQALRHHLLQYLLRTGQRNTRGELPAVTHTYRRLKCPHNTRAGAKPHTPSWSHVPREGFRTSTLITHRIVFNEIHISFTVIRVQSDVPPIAQDA